MCYRTSVWALLSDLKLMTMIAVCLTTMTLTVKSETRLFVRYNVLLRRFGIVLWQRREWCLNPIA